ncbi:TetR/AcrR family transcriptional regulator [Leptospira adleri]|uniref:TetR family transcriptional regulator n=1 Tax=Leptospira adleri TaxID=2023186 RepID=A0A2M9YIB6_9LEPT|nr:TetR/AcrR family transcriptional regulator [Leptospira adleri]PJZ51254.1 TetR family transcriptional regulator [Leptospira adleri]PJZ59866.1 TetR family transcriptional regulator [Leptospira adleri]TGM61965.1 TetR/AcrR family transcriptional regulator [Leptospira adleri]
MQEIKESIELDPGWPEGQKKIFLAAMEIFAQKGFSATTTGEIAKKAGVAEGLIFKHFKSKKELLLSLAMPIMESFIAPLTLKRLKAIFSQDYATFEEFLSAVFEERISFIRKNRNLIRIIVQEAMISVEIRAILERVFKQKLAPLMMERLKEFQERGLIKDIPVLSAFRLVATNLSGYIFLTEIFFQPGEDWEAESELKSTIEFVADGLTPKKNTRSNVKPQTKKKKTFPKSTKTKKKK